MITFTDLQPSMERHIALAGFFWPGRMTIHSIKRCDLDPALNACINRLCKTIHRSPQPIASAMNVVANPLHLGLWQSWRIKREAKVMVIGEMKHNQDTFLYTLLNRPELHAKAAYMQSKYLKEDMQWLEPNYGKWYCFCMAMKHNTKTQEKLAEEENWTEEGPLNESEKKALMQQMIRANILSEVRSLMIPLSF